jgi:hypothetical protein
MATRALQQVVCYTAWDTSANAYKTGDSANHTTYWTKDGTASATTNATAEVDATHFPGLYKVTMTSTETDCIEGVLGGKSSTANVVLIPTMVAFDYLNTSAPAAAGIQDVNVKNMNNVAATAITTIKAVQGLTTADTIATYTGNTPQTGDSFARLTGTGAVTFASLTVSGATALTGAVTATNGSNNITGVTAAVTGSVTVGTNNDKTGYSLTQSFPSNFASLAITGGGLVSSNDFTTQLTESYRAFGAAPTPAQATFEILAHLTNSGISGTTKTMKKLDRATTAKTATLDSATTPASIVEAS